jgi:hypothetical protein
MAALLTLDQVDVNSLLLSGGLALLASILTGTFILYRRSDRGRAAKAFRNLGKIPHPLEAAVFLDRVAMELPLARRRAVIERLAGHMDRAAGDPRQLCAEIMHAAASVLGLIELRDHRPQMKARQQVAQAMEQYAAAHSNIARRFRQLGLHDWEATVDQAAAESYLFAVMLKAASPAQLMAVRPQLQELCQSRKRSSPARTPVLDSVVDAELLAEIDATFDSIEPAGRATSDEDRALFLGQALTRTLQAHEHLLERYFKSPTVTATVALVALDSLRDLLATSLRDLHQRAELAVELRSRLLVARREAVVVLELRNVGDGHAMNVVVELAEDVEHFRVPRPRQSLKTLLRHQSARLEFLIEPQASDRVRLIFQCRFDDAERQGQTFEFADMMELQQVTEDTFRPFYPNPYVVGRPLGEGDVFVGREKILKRITQSFNDDEQDHVALLIGQRRMGKTSILRRLRLCLADTHVPVLVDLQGFLSTGEAAFFRELIAVIHDELAEVGIDVEEPPPEALAADPTNAFEQHFLRQVTQILGTKRLLVMFDELEVLEERIQAGDLTPRILPYLRNLMRSEDSIRFLFSGTHRLDQLAGDHWTVFLNLAVYFDVGHFSPPQLGKLFTAPADGFFNIDALALDKAFQLTGGHPHFSQLVARELVEFRNRGKISYVTVQDMNTVADAVVDKGQLHITYTWNEASRDERLLLLAVGELLDSEGLASTATAERYLSQRRVEPDDLPAAAYRLQHKGVLTSHAGQLSFRMELLRRWLRRHHSLELFLLPETSQNPPGVRDLLFAEDESP